MTDRPRRRVVITGAAGNVGRKVVASLRSRKDLDLLLLDLETDLAADIIAADLSVAGSWVQLLEGTDIVLHLAGNPHVDAEWPDLARHNVDATLNVLDAAVGTGVARVILASSLQVLLGYQGGIHISTDLPPRPVNFYGVSKAVGERVAERMARLHGISIICLRLGMVREGDNQPPVRHPSIAVQWRWLSDRDLCRAIQLALDAGSVVFAAAGVTSSNLGSPWSLEEARQLLGYEPLDCHVPVPAGLIQRGGRRLRGALRRRGLWLGVRPLDAASD